LQAAKSPAAESWAKRIGSDLYPLGQAETLKMLQTQQDRVKKYHHAILG
jgi:hypothetical protein